MSGKKRTRFLKFIGIKKRTAKEVFDGLLPKAMDALRPLPKESTQRAELIERIKTGATLMQAEDPGMKAHMEAVIRDAKAAAEAAADLARQPTISEPVPTADTAQRMDAKVATKTGAAAEIVTYRNEAVVALNKVRQAVAALNTAVNQLDTDLSDPRTKFDDTLKNLEGLLREDLQDLELRHAAPLDKALADGDIDQDEFDTRLATFVGLRESRGGAFEAVCDEKVAEIMAAIGDTTALSALAGEAKALQARDADLKAYRARIKTIDGLLGTLEDWGVGAASALRAQFDGLTPDAPEDVDAAMTALDDFKATVLAAKEDATSEYDTRAAEVRQSLKDTISKSDRIFTSLDDALNTKWAQTFYSQVKLENMLITSMIDTGKNMQALEEAQGLIDDLLARLTDFEGNMEVVNETRELHTKISRILEAKVVAKSHPILQESLSKEFDALFKASRTAAASVNFSNYQAFAPKVFGPSSSLEELVRHRVAWQKTFKAETGEVEQRIDDMLTEMRYKDHGTPLEAGFFDSYEGSLAGKITEAQNLSENEDMASMEAAMRLLAEAKMEANHIRVAFEKKPDERSDEENERCAAALASQSEGVEAAKQLERDKAAFEQKYQSFKLSLQGTEMLGGKRPEVRGEVEAIRQMGKDAKGVMKSTENYERASKILDAAYARLRKVNAFDSRSVGDLVEINKKWNSAVGKLEAGAESLQSAAQTAADAVGDDARKTAAGTVADLIKTTAATRLPQDAFKEAADAYRAGGLSQAQILRLREKTLKQITLMKEFISNDPILRAAQANPFGEKNVISPVFLALRDIEYSVLVTT